MPLVASKLKSRGKGSDDALAQAEKSQEIQADLIFGKDNSIFSNTVLKREPHRPAGDVLFELAGWMPNALRALFHL